MIGDSRGQGGSCGGGGGEGREAGTKKEKPASCPRWTYNVLRPFRQTPWSRRGHPPEEEKEQHSRRQIYCCAIVAIVILKG